MLPIIHQQRWHLGVDILEHLHSDTRRASGAGRVTIVGADDYPNLLPKREWMRICKNCILRADRWLKVLTPEPSTPVWESGHGRDQVACDAALAHQSASVVTLVLRRSNDFVRQFMIFHSESCVSECSADRAAVCGHYLGRGPAVVTLYEHRGWAGPNRAAANALQKVFGHESFEQHFAGIILGEAHRW